MAATFISDSVLNYGGRTNSTIAAPAGIANLDELRMLFAVGAGGGAPAATPPAGFVSVGAGFPYTVTDGGFVLSVDVYQKTAGGAEPANYTVTHAAGNSAAWMCTVRGAVNGGSQATFGTDPGGVNPVAPSVTTLTDQALLIFFAQSFNFLGAVTEPASPPVWTERLDSGASILYVATGNFSPAGATGTRTVTVTQQPSSAGLIVLESAAPVGGDGHNSRIIMIHNGGIK